ncbi:MAG: rplR [Chlamydiia bacterium]|nr:rplR [Chlamydiia bacterium]
MEKNIIKAYRNKCRRAMRVRQHVQGTAEKPRMCVVKTNKHIEVQIIDDEKSVTLVSLSTNSKELRKTEFSKRNKASAKYLGEKIAEKAKALGVGQVVFDRGPFKYHGILAELATGARSFGLQF